MRLLNNLFGEDMEEEDGVEENDETAHDQAYDQLNGESSTTTAAVKKRDELACTQMKALCDLLTDSRREEEVYNLPQQHTTHNSSVLRPFTHLICTLLCRNL